MPSAWEEHLVIRAAQNEELIMLFLTITEMRMIKFPGSFAWIHAYNLHFY